MIAACDAALGRVEGALGPQPDRVAASLGVGQRDAPLGEGVDDDAGQTSGGGFCSCAEAPQPELQPGPNR